MFDRVRAVLEYQGRSQKWLARQLGVSESLVSKVFDGERSMPADWPDKIARSLDTPPSLLFFDAVSGSPDRFAASIDGRTGS